MVTLIYVGLEYGSGGVLPFEKVVVDLCLASGYEHEF